MRVIYGAKFDNYKMTIIQKPNLPLTIAIFGFLTSKFTSGVFHKFGEVIYTVAIIVWAYQEITTGASWFRKLLGAVVLAVVSYSLFNQLD